MNKALPRLTLKTAESLIYREIGTVKGLKRETETPTDIYIYKMMLGTLYVTLDNGWFGRNGRLQLTIDTGDGQSITKYFDPKTLDEDYPLFDSERDKQRREEHEEYICAIGLEGCRKIIDKN